MVPFFAPKSLVIFFLGNGKGLASSGERSNGTVLSPRRPASLKGSLSLMANIQSGELTIQTHYEEKEEECASLPEFDEEEREIETAEGLPWRILFLIFSAIGADAMTILLIQPLAYDQVFIFFFHSFSSSLKKSLLLSLHCSVARDLGWTSQLVCAPDL